MQMRSKVGNKHKGQRSMRKKVYYERFRQRYSGKLIRRRGDRERRRLAAKAHPEIGSPSQLRERKRRGLICCS